MLYQLYVVFFCLLLVAPSRTHLVLKFRSCRTSVVTPGLIAPGVQAGSGRGKPLLTRGVQCWGGGRSTCCIGFSAAGSTSWQSICAKAGGAMSSAKPISQPTNE